MDAMELVKTSSRHVTMPVAVAIAEEQAASVVETVAVVDGLNSRIAMNEIIMR